MTQFNTIKLSIVAFVLLLSLDSFGQAGTCEDPFIIPNSGLVILDTLHTTPLEGTDFYQFTVPEDGYLSFSNCGSLTTYHEDFVNIYQGSCSDLIETVTFSPGCVQDVEWESPVVKDDVYLFEWDIDDSDGAPLEEDLYPIFFYARHYPYNCATAQTINCLGEFEVECRRTEPWHKWIAPTSGTFELGLAEGHGIEPEFDSYGVQMNVYKEGCQGNWVAWNDPNDEYAFEESVTFNAIAGETFNFYFKNHGYDNGGQPLYLKITKQGIEPDYSYHYEISECDSFEFDGEALTTSGDYQSLFTDQNGCDSLVDLALTIASSYDLLYETTACGSYLFDGTEITETGQYQAAFQSQAGCDSLVTLNLNVVSYDLSITGNETSLTVAVDLLKGSYQWVNCETGAMILGATERTFEPQTAGQYKVIINSEGCEQESACTSIDLVTGSRSADQGLIMYPNPTRGPLEVHLPEPSRITNVKISDLTGRIIHDKRYIGKEKISVNINGKKGIYLVELTSDERTEIVKVYKY